MCREYPDGTSLPAYCSRQWVYGWDKRLCVGQRGDSFAIADLEESVTHETTDATNFYNREYDYVAGVSDGMYRASDGDYIWASPPWYWWYDNYPQFVRLKGAVPTYKPKRST
jgi:hypothetical protein